MQSYVYKSLKRADTYLFLAERDNTDRLPEALRLQLGELRLVMELDLQPGRRLAREDAATVMGNLATRGFHLQFPPSTAGDPMSEDWGTDA